MNEFPAGYTAVTKKQTICCHGFSFRDDFESEQKNQIMYQEFIKVKIKKYKKKKEGCVCVGVCTHIFSVT